MHTIKNLLVFCTLFISLCKPLASTESSPKEVHIVTIPKSGTHLILRVWDLLAEAGYKYPKFWMHPHFLQSPTRTNIEKFKETFSEKKIFMIRDLRDVYVSATFWLDQMFEDMTAPEHRVRDWLPKWSEATFQEKLVQLIDGSLVFDNPISLINFNIFASLPSLIHPDSNTLVIRFEDLVGEKGGGDNQKQLDTLQRIFDFCGYDIPEETKYFVAANLFGESYTFRKGVIGSWKDHFNRKVKAHFKQKLGGALILMGYETDYNW